MNKRKKRLDADSYEIINYISKMLKTHKLTANNFSALCNSRTELYKAYVQSTKKYQPQNEIRLIFKG